MYTPYTYPDAPNVSSRETTNVPLREGRSYSIETIAPTQVVAKNTVPDPYTPMANQPVYGTQPFGLGYAYDEMPQDMDIVPRWYVIAIQDGLFYKTSGYYASQQLPSYAAVTPSITTPTLGASFVNARGRGDIYGA